MLIGLQGPEVLTETVKALPPDMPLALVIEGEQTAATGADGGVARGPPTT